MIVVAVQCDSFVAFLQPTLLFKDTAYSLLATITIAFVCAVDIYWFIVACNGYWNDIGIAIVLPHAHHPQAAVIRSHHNREVTVSIKIELMLTKEIKTTSAASYLEQT